MCFLINSICFLRKIEIKEISEAQIAVVVSCDCEQLCSRNESFTTVNHDCRWSKHGNETT